MLIGCFSERNRMKTILRFIKFVVSFTVVILLVTTITIGTVYFYFAHDLPNIQSFEDYSPHVVSEVFSDDGTKMGEFWIEKRYLTPFDEIPKLVVEAFVASEDARFFEHRGVDVRGIGRAFYENLKAGHVVQGGSTITQQVTKSILLTRERSYVRKIKEAILATRMDRTLSKKEILEIYLNQIYLGNRAYGIEAAAQNYFNKELKELTIAEAAMIAGLTQAPATDNPVVSPRKAKERQTYVLRRMYDVDYITKDQMNTALNETLIIYASDLDKDFNNKYAPYYTEEIRRMMIDKYGEKAVYEGGLKIHTPANIEMNQAAQKAVQHGLEALDHRRGYRGPTASLTEDEIPAFLESEHKAALNAKYNGRIIIPETEEEKAIKAGPTPLNKDDFYKAVVTGFGDNGRSIEIKVGHNSGKITADGYRWAWGYFGGRPSARLKIGDVVMAKITDTDGEYSLFQIPKAQAALFSMIPQNGFVKAMSGGFDYRYSEFNRATQALRQPGSSFKPIIYASALDKGYTYSHPVLDSPVVFKVGDEIWTPKNYGGKFSGNTTFESNLVYSRNVPTVKIANSVGTHYITAYARKLGLTNYFYKYLSMSLGANSVYLQEMVTMFSTIANHGRKPERILITKVEDSKGNVIEEYTPPEEPLPPSVAYLKSESTDPKSTELNSTLFEANKKFIETDNLQLSEEELRVLYGKAIPDGYVMTPKTAYLICNLLQQVVKRGTGARVQALDKPVAGKTGTTNDETDAWFIGFVPELAAGVWVGHDVKKSLGRGEQGGRTAAPIFLEYMQVATKDLGAKDFQPPEGMPIEQIATLKGGSAIYSTGFERQEAAAWFGVTHEIQDRAVDFYEEDMGF